LAQYQKLEPANLRYDSSEKRYVPTLEFKPRFMTPNADRYLVQLQAIADNVIGLSDTWITDAPNVGVMPVPERRIDSKIFKRLVAAIRGQRSIEVHFQSMNVNRPEAIWRRITPHAFANDGLRWHVRAFCHIDRTFKDFILSRCRDLRNEDEAGAKGAEDSRWHTIFDVVLKPNPQLTDSQQLTIAMDYDMNDGRAIVPVRQALLYYFEKRLRLDLDAKRDSAAERPVVIHNRDEFNKARDVAKA
jgi:predicted DNA-binding transcriptional regulator YafY